MRKVRSRVATPLNAIENSTAACIKHFWKCNGLGSDGQLVDSVGGADFVPTINAMVAYDGYVSLNDNGTMPVTVSKPFTTIGTSSFIMLAVFASEGSLLGSGFHCQHGTDEWELWQGDGSSSFLGSAVASAIARQTYPIGVGFAFKPSTTARAFWIDSDGSMAEEDLDVSADPSIGAFGQEITIAGNAVTGINALYGLIHMHFDDLPSDYMVGCAWMSHEWQQGRKVIYPSWIS